MSCRKCHGLLVPDLELGIPPTERCINCGWRPPPVLPTPRPRLRLWSLITHSRAPADRGCMLEALADCARQFKRPPTKDEFDAYCKRYDKPFRAYSLVNNRRHQGYSYWPDILREAGIEPTPSQIKRSLGRRDTKYGVKGEAP